MVWLLTVGATDPRTLALPGASGERPSDVDTVAGPRAHADGAPRVRPVPGEIIVTGAVVGSDTTIDALLAAALAHVRRSRTEPGCLSHHVYRDAEEPNRLFFFERWADRAALDAHFAVPASLEFVARLRELAVEEPSLHITPTV
jgi:quinol monooxygenase YgiN